MLSEICEKNNAVLKLSLYLMSTNNRLPGLDISVVRAIYDLVKEKAARLHMWKGTKSTSRKYKENKYLRASKVFDIFMDVPFIPCFVQLCISELIIYCFSKNTIFQHYQRGSS